MIWKRYLVRFTFDDGPAPGAEKSSREGAQACLRELVAGGAGPSQGPEPIWEAAIAYWESRGFRCGMADDVHLVGRRGSWIGNLFGIDMRRLTCDLDVRRDPEGPWSIQMLLEGKFQYLSEWSFSELALEQILFRRAVLGLPPTLHLDQYRVAAQRAAVIGSLTLTLGGRRLPKFWRQVMGQLAAPHDSPSVERVGA